MRAAEMQTAWLARPTLRTCQHCWKGVSSAPSWSRPTHSIQDRQHRLTRRACTKASHVKAATVMAAGCATVPLRLLPLLVPQQTGTHLSALSPQVSSAVPCRGESVVKDWIAENLDSGKVTKEQLAGSSQWSSAYVYDTESGQKFFVKLSLGRDSSMFEGEALGLQALYGMVHHVVSRYRRVTTLITIIFHMCRHSCNENSKDIPFWLIIQQRLLHRHGVFEVWRVLQPSRLRTSTSRNAQGRTCSKSRTATAFCMCFT